jgi:hypothetical protein
MMARVRIVALALITGLSIGAASCASPSQNAAGNSDRAHSSPHMPDGKEWLTENLNLHALKHAPPWSEAVREFAARPVLIQRNAA